MSKTLADEFAEDFGSEGEEEEQKPEIKTEDDDGLGDLEAEDASAMEVETPTVNEIRAIAKLAHGTALKSIVEVNHSHFWSYFIFQTVNSTGWWCFWFWNKHREFQNRW